MDALPLRPPSFREGVPRSSADGRRKTGDGVPRRSADGPRTTGDGSDGAGVPSVVFCEVGVNGSAACSREDSRPEELLSLHHIETDFVHERPAAHVIINNNAHGRQLSSGCGGSSSQLHPAAHASG